MRKAQEQRGKPVVEMCHSSSFPHVSFVSGICVEALCSPTSTQNIETVNLCLKSIYTLLDDPWPRSRIGQDNSLGIELLNVMHRSASTNNFLTCRIREHLGLTAKEHYGSCKY